MSKDNNYTLDQIKKNLSQFQKKLKDKNMYENFWVIADRSDFKPLHKLEKKINSKTKLNSKKNLKENSKKKSKENSKKNSKNNSKVNLKTKSKMIIHSIKELKDNFLDDRGEYYKDKKFANIKVIINDRVLNLLDIIREYKNIANENLLTVQIIIFKISSTGNINFSDKNELKVKYTPDDFRKFHFKLKNLEVLMRLVTDSVIKTNTISGISYKTLLEKINKKK
jgi:hypothetical protein